MWGKGWKEGHFCHPTKGERSANFKNSHEGKKLFSTPEAREVDAVRCDLGGHLMLKIELTVKNSWSRLVTSNDVQGRGSIRESASLLQSHQVKISQAEQALAYIDSGHFN